MPGAGAIEVLRNPSLRFGVLERGDLNGSQAADFIRASGHVNRINAMWAPSTQEH